MEAKALSEINKQLQKRLLQTAVESMRSERLSIRQAADRFGVSKSTLHREMQKAKQAENSTAPTIADELESILKKLAV